MPARELVPSSASVLPICPAAPPRGTRRGSYLRAPASAPVRPYDPRVTRRDIRSWLMDMDGVLVHEEQAIPGANRFLAGLRETGTPFLVLTNNSIYTRRDLSARLRASGL